MPLNAQQKDALSFQLCTLLELDEPEAVLSTLQRIAERKAFSATLGAIELDEAERWQALADALASVRHELANASQTPAQARSRLTAFSPPP